MKKIAAFSSSLLFSLLNLVHNFVNPLVLTSQLIDEWSLLSGNRTLNMDLSGLSIESIESDAFNGFKELESLYLTDNNLAFLNSSVFSGLQSLHTLWLDNNALTKIDKLDGLHALKTLNLAHNRLVSVETDLFRNLTHLLRLNLEFNSISTLNPYVFDDLASLSELILANNALTSWNGSLLAELGLSLSKLDLNNNRIGRLGSVSSVYMYELNELTICNNGLRALDEQAFKCLVKLVKLDLSANLLNSLVAVAHKNLANLKHLSLAKNRIAVIPADTFTNLESLETLDLTYNQVKSLDSLTSKHMSSSLGLLYLNHNQIDMIPDSTFTYLKSLKVLNLSHNRIQELGVDAFGRANSLTLLDLSFNRIQKLGEFLFYDLGQLVYLSFAHNNLTNMSNDSFFSMLSSLSTLILSNNSIEKVNARAFGRLPALKTLSLASNLLRVVDVNAFFCVKQLAELDLCGNAGLEFPTVASCDDWHTLKAAWQANKSVLIDPCSCSNNCRTPSHETPLMQAIANTSPITWPPDCPASNSSTLSSSSSSLSLEQHTIIDPQLFLNSQSPQQQPLTSQANEIHSYNAFEQQSQFSNANNDYLENTAPQPPFYDSTSSSLNYFGLVSSSSNIDLSPYPFETSPLVSYSGCYSAVGSCNNSSVSSFGSSSTSSSQESNPSLSSLNTTNGDMDILFYRPLSESGSKQDVSVGTELHPTYNDRNYKKEFPWAAGPLVGQHQSQVNELALFTNEINLPSYANMSGGQPMLENQPQLQKFTIHTHVRRMDESESFKLVEKIQPKKSRTKYTKEQIELLESAFVCNAYPEVSTVERMCKELCVSKEKINNRRARSKRNSSAAAADATTLL